MHAADAIQHAKAALYEADRMAQGGFPEVTASLVAVADGWTRLAATLAEHPIAAFTEVHVHADVGAPTEAEILRHVDRHAASATRRP